MMSAVRAPQSKPATIACRISERVHQGDAVRGEGGLLAVARRVGRAEARGAVAAQVRDDHRDSRRAARQRRDLGEGVDVVGPAVQQQDRRTILGPHLDIADVENAGVDLLQRAEGGRRGGARGGADLRRQAGEGAARPWPRKPRRLGSSEGAEGMAGSFGCGSKAALSFRRRAGSIAGVSAGDRRPTASGRGSVRTQILTYSLVSIDSVGAAMPVPLFVEQRHQGRGDDRGGNMSRFAYTVSLVALMAAATPAIAQTTAAPRVSRRRQHRRGGRGHRDPPQGTPSGRAAQRHRLFAG